MCFLCQIEEEVEAIYAEMRANEQAEEESRLSLSLPSIPQPSSATPSATMPMDIHEQFRQSPERTRNQIALQFRVM